MRSICLEKRKRRRSLCCVTTCHEKERKMRQTVHSSGNMKRTECRVTCSSCFHSFSVSTTYPSASFCIISCSDSSASNIAAPTNKYVNVHTINERVRKFCLFIRHSTLFSPLFVFNVANFALTSDHQSSGSTGLVIIVTPSRGGGGKKKHFHYQLTCMLLLGMKCGHFTFTFNSEM